MELLAQADTVSQICSKYSIHPTQARRWKEAALTVLRNSFNQQTITNRLNEKDKLIDELYKQIGQLKVELDWLKKKMGVIS